MRFTSSSFRRSLKQKKRARTLRKRLQRRQRTRRFRSSKQKGGLIPNSGDPSAKGVFAGPLKEEKLPVEEAVLYDAEELQQVTQT